MRRGSVLAAIAAAATMVVCQSISAAQSADERLLGIPIGPRSALPRLKFDKPVLAPFAYTLFCRRYEGECRDRPLFRGGSVPLTEARLADLTAVNQTVNRAIAPDPSERSLATEEAWLIDPARGDCNDYAVSKRHHLLKSGWPQRTLLLGEVVTAWGKRRLVLVVRTSGGDMVLDNLTPQIRLWSRTPYRWVRIQSPAYPRYWNLVAPRGV
jgi:predicted transglutaminase-like cysteine proteinase